MCFGAEIKDVETAAGVTWRAFGQKAALEAYFKRAEPFYKPVVAAYRTIAAAFKADPKFVADGITLYNAVVGVALPGTGMAAPDVPWVQRTLNEINGADLTVDGVYGASTTAAVTAYQKRRGLAVDGWVGPSTFGQMKADLGKVQQGGK